MACLSNMHVQYSPGVGRHVLAGLSGETGSEVAVSKGEVVMECPVTVLSIREVWKKRTCSYCLEVAAQRLQYWCAQCQQCYYCSSQCLELHRVNGAQNSNTAPHLSLCPALQRFSGLKRFGKTEMSVLRLALEVMFEEATSPHLHPEGSATTTSLATFWDLEWHPLVHQDEKEASNWLKVSEKFLAAVDACDWCPWQMDLASRMTSEGLHQLLSRIDSNAFGCFVGEPGDSCEASGRRMFAHGVYISASVFNHSCRPNCDAATTPTRIVIRATEDVPQGHELTIAYIDTNQPLAARRKELQALYNFTCHCSRCSQEEASKPQEKLSYHRKGHGAKTKRTKAELRQRRAERAEQRTGRKS